MTYVYLLCIILGVIGMTVALNETCISNNTQSLWRKEEFPNPRIDIESCGRNCSSSWICDPSNVLSFEQADELDDKIADIAASSTCDCSECSNNDGYNISIAIISGMVLPPGTDKTTAAREFADFLRKEWNFQICGNNVVILISQVDRQVYTVAGPSAIRKLTLECIETIYNEVRPILSSEKYYDALNTMLSRYKNVFSTGHCKLDEKTRFPISIIVVIVIAVFGCFGLPVCFCIKRRCALRKYASSGQTHIPMTHIGGRGGFSAGTGYTSRSGIGYTSNNETGYTSHSSPGGDTGGFSGGFSSDGGGGGGGDF